MARNIKATIGNDGNPNHTYSLSSQNGAGTITVMRTGITFTELRASVVIAYPDDIVNVLAKDESPSCAASGYVSLPIPPLPSPTPTPSVTSSPTPSITPTTSIIHSTEARRLVEFWGSPPDQSNNRLGASTASGVCNTNNSFVGYIRQSEYDQYIIAGDPSGITIIYDGINGNFTINGSDRWFYPAPSTTSSTTKRTFQLSTNGIPYNFTTIICPSPSPTPSTTPTPTPSITPSNTPTPTPSVTHGLFLNGNLLTSDPSTPYSAPISFVPDGNYLFTQQGAGSYTLSGQISGGVWGWAVFRLGAGNTLTISGNNTYQGRIAVQSGAIAITNANALGAGGEIALEGGNLVINNSAFTNGVLNLTNTVNIADAYSGYVDLVGNGTSENTLTLNTGNISLDGNGTLTFTRSTGGSGTTNIGSTFSGSGTLEIGNTNGGNVLSATSKGEFVATNNAAYNNFTGAINILQNGNLAVYGGPLNKVAGNDVTVQTGGILSLNSSGININYLSGNGRITYGASTSVQAVLSINSGSFPGVIGSNTTVGGTGIMRLVKITNSTLTLFGNNNYSGGTQLDDGTITMQNNNALGTGTVVVNAAGTLNKNGFNPPNTIVNNGGTVNP